MVTYLLMASSLGISLLDESVSLRQIGTIVAMTRSKSEEELNFAEKFITKT